MFGLENALKSCDECFDTRFPRKSVWSKKRQHSASSVSDAHSDRWAKHTRDDVMSSDAERAKQIVYSVVAQLR
jgi:hypothetical protein